MGGGVWPHELGWEGSCETAVSVVHGDNIPNKFRILKERHIQMRKPYQLTGWTKNSSYIIVPRSIQRSKYRGIQSNQYISINARGDCQFNLSDLI